MSKPTGGKLLEAARMTVFGEVGDVVRLWVVCTYDKGPAELAPEHCVYVRPSDRLPTPGEHVWWCKGVVYFGDSNEQLKKVGWSFPAPSMAGEE
jgi:hypothetical protein